MGAHELAVAFKNLIEKEPPDVVFPALALTVGAALASTCEGRPANLFRVQLEHDYGAFLMLLGRCVDAAHARGPLAPTGERKAE